MCPAGRAAALLTIPGSCPGESDQTCDAAASTARRSSTALNTSIKNADFSTKKKDGYADSDIVLTKELLTLNTWDTAAIDKRQAELSDWVFAIWKFPGEARPAKPDRQPEAPEPEPADETETAVDQLPEVPA